jgi:hemerythrin superfamily protein
MAKVSFDLDDLTNAALKRLVKQLLSADEAEEQQIMKRLAKRKPSKNELADLDEEMHGKPNTPKVTKEDLPDEEDS